MNLFSLPWLELCLVVPIAGAACVRLSRDTMSAYRCCIWFVGATLACSVMSSIGYFSGQVATDGTSALWDWTGRRILAVDELNAPLLPLVALLHLLTVIATARTKMPRFSFAGLLVGAAVRLGAFASAEPWLLVALLVFDAFLPVLDLRHRGRPMRLHLIHAGVFALLLVVGWACVSVAGSRDLGALLLVMAALVRTGAFPAQVWVTDVFSNGTFGAALLFATPLTGVYAAVRLVLPIAPEWTLEVLGIAALGTAVYAASMGVVQQDARRFFAYLFLSHASLVLVGLGLHTPFAVTGALVMGLSTSLSLLGLGLTLRAVEARVGSLSLTEYRGLYQQSPALAVCFLITGLAVVGFPGTSGFVSVELLVDEAVGAHIGFGVVVVLIAALNGISVVRAYLLLFTGRKHTTGVSLGITPRESAAVLTLVALIFIGGLLPQAYVESRHRAAESLLRERLPPSTESLERKH